MALSEQETQTRRKYIGGSDAKTVLEGDAAEWQALRAEKVDDVRPVFNERQLLLMDMGTAVEPLALRELNKKVPVLTEKLPHFVWKDDPILAFTPDALTAEWRDPGQVKFHTGDKNIFELAEYYKAQLTHEMICTTKTRIWLAVLFGHYGKFQHLEVKRDETLVEQYLMKAMEFKEYLKTGVLPSTMVETVSTMAVERKRDHVWAVADNEVSSLCNDIMENLAASLVFEDALDKMKKIIK